MKNTEPVESIQHHITELAPMPWWAEWIPNTFITLSGIVIVVATVVLIIKLKNKGAVLMGSSLFLYVVFIFAPLFLYGGEGSIEPPNRQVLLMLDVFNSICMFSFTVGFYLVCREVWRSKSG